LRQPGITDRDHCSDDKAAAGTIAGDRDAVRLQTAAQ
jgi:hypothetical protein